MSQKHLLGEYVIRGIFSENTSPGTNSRRMHLQRHILGEHASRGRFSENANENRPANENMPATRRETTEAGVKAEATSDWSGEELEQGTRGANQKDKK